MSHPIQQAADAVARGGVIVYPTDTLWGLGAGLRHVAGIERVFAIKERPRDQPLSIAVASVADIPRYARLTPLGARLTRLLPGAVTLILPKAPSVPDAVTGGRDHVGIRVPNHAGCLALLARTGPLTSTSANLHGGPEPRDVNEARDVFGNRVDFYLDSDSPPTGVASTIVDARTDSVKILRLGALSESRIREVVR